MSADEPSGEYAHELVMPFVLVRSKGGPYDDDAFCAGFECGKLDAALGSDLRSSLLKMPVTVGICRTALAAQYDLIAMRHGYTVTIEPSDEYPEWGSATFTPDRP